MAILSHLQLQPWPMRWPRPIHSGDAPVPSCRGAAGLTRPRCLRRLCIARGPPRPVGAAWPGAVIPLRRQALGAMWTGRRAASRARPPREQVLDRDEARPQQSPSPSLLDRRPLDAAHTTWLRRWAGQGTSPILASGHCLEGLRQKATHPAKPELARPGPRCAIRSEPDFRYGTFLKPARPATTRPRAIPPRERL